MLTEEYKIELLKRATANKSLLIPTGELAEVRRYLSDQGLFIQERMQRDSKVEVSVYSHRRHTIHLLTGTAYLMVPKDVTNEDCEIMIRFLDEMKNKLQK